MSDPETRAEYARPILERHESAASEADIRSAVRDFLIHTGLAPASEIQQEQAPAPGESGRVDLRTRDVIFEFKRSIRIGVNPYADNLIAAVAGRQPRCDDPARPECLRSLASTLPARVLKTASYSRQPQA